MPITVLDTEKKSDRYIVYECTMMEIVHFEHFARLKKLIVDMKLYFNR